MHKNHLELPSLGLLEAKASEIDKLTSISQHPADTSTPVFNCLASCSGSCSLSCSGMCTAECAGNCEGSCKGGFFSRRA